MPRLVFGIESKGSGDVRVFRLPQNNDILYVRDEVTIISSPNYCFATDGRLEPRSLDVSVQVVTAEDGTPLSASVLFKELSYIFPQKIDDHRAVYQMLTVLAPAPFWTRWEAFKHMFWTRVYGIS